jgi:hypothetical protein
MAQEWNPYEAPKAQQEEVPVDDQSPLRPSAGSVALLVILQIATNALLGLAARTMHLKVALPGGVPVLGMLLGGLVFALRERRNRPRSWGRNYAYWLALHSTLIWSVMTVGSVIIVRRAFHSGHAMTGADWGIVIIRPTVLNYIGTAVGLALGAWAMRNRRGPSGPDAPTS